MKIGIGLPNTVPGTPGDQLVDWGRRAEELGFAGLATIDRLNYPNHDSLATLAAVAGATSRIGLMTNILLAPLYPPPLLAKAAATIDQVSRGRFALGLAPGGRPDDYALVGVDFHRRGTVFDRSLDLLHRAWRGEPLDEGEMPATPTPVADRRVPILVGGASAATLRRVAEWGAGWTAGGVPPEMVGGFVEQVRAAWRDAGRAGEPRIAALAYFSLGDDVLDDSTSYLKHYYAFLGEYADTIAGGALRTPDAIRGALQAYRDVGVTELYLDPTTSAPSQLERLADLVL